MAAPDYEDQFDQELLEEEAPPVHNDTEGVWLISYADMMTLLMGFFALLTSMSSFDEETFKEAGAETALYFGGEVIKPYEELGKSIQAFSPMRQAS